MKYIKNIIIILALSIVMVCVVDASTANIQATVNIQIPTENMPQAVSTEDKRITPDLTDEIPPGALVLEGDNVRYLEENKFVEAKGKVLLVYKNYRVTANQLTVDTEQDQLYVAKGFIMRRQNEEISGQVLDYNMKTETGKAEEAKLTFYGNYIKGKEIIIGKDKILITKATMTRCDKEPPHYHLKCERITIYTRWNIIVADHSLLHISGIPIMYVPNYVISSQMETASQELIPRIGHNRVEGDYVKVKMGYHVNEKIQGTLDIESLSELEYRLGFSNTSLLDSYTYVQTRIHSVGGKGFELGLKYRTLLGVPEELKSPTVSDYFRGLNPLNSAEYFEIIGELTEREIVGETDVSYLPRLAVRFPTIALFDNLFNLYVNTEYANLTEEGILHEGVTENYKRLKGVTTLGWSRYFQELAGTLYYNLNYEASFYHKENYAYFSEWERFYSNIGIKKNIWILHNHLNYRHTHDQHGYSAFEFDQFNIASPYEINLDTYFYLGSNIVGAHWDYDIEAEEYRNIDYRFIWDQHCWQFVFIWKTKLKAFEFNFNLK